MRKFTGTVGTRTCTCMLVTCIQTLQQSGTAECNIGLGYITILYTHTRMYTHTRTCTHTHTHARTHTQTRTHTRIYAHTHTHIRTYARTHAYTPTPTHTRTSTHTHLEHGVLGRVWENDLGAQRGVIHNLVLGEPYRTGGAAVGLVGAGRQVNREVLLVAGMVAEVRTADYHQVTQLGVLLGRVNSTLIPHNIGS